MKQTDPADLFKALWGLVEKLRGPGGCPWDAKQTAGSIKTYLLEEAYEVADAVERESPEEVSHELGDLLFQILFMVSIYKGRGEFDLQDVLETIHKKMVRRHPHVFGPTEVTSAEEVAANWEKIKKEELGLSENARWPLEKVPGNLPALQRAYRLMERAVNHHLLSATDEERWGNVQEKWIALKEASQKEDRQGVATALGDLLFGLVAVARERGLNAEDLLREKNRHFVEEAKQSEKGDESDRDG